MTCISCRRRVDPNRSFCSSCGSASFTDAAPSLRRSLGGRAQTATTVSTSILDDGGVSARVPVSRAEKAARQAAARQASAAAAKLGGCVAAMVRLAVFVTVLWYVGGWLLSIPEVATLRDAALNGSFSDDQVTAALHAIREDVLAFLNSR